MNSRPAGTTPAADGANDSGSVHSGEYGETLGFTQKHAFVIRTKSIDAAQAPATDPSARSFTASALSTHALKKPQMGDNVYLIRLFKNADLDGVSNAATLTVQYLRSSAKIKKTFTAVVQKNSDGTFTSTLTFKKRGTWEVHMQVTDGASTDEHVFQLTLS